MAANNPPLMFRLVGWFVCNKRNMGKRFRALMAHARLETNNFTSNMWKVGSGAWCMWYSETGTPRADAKWNGEGEPVALYGTATGSTFDVRRYARMWNDRLDWDKRKAIREEDFNSIAGYAEQVVQAGWFGTKNGLPMPHPQFPPSVVGFAESWTSWLTWPLSFFIGAGIENSRSWNFGRWLILLVVLGVLYIILRLMLRPFAIYLPPKRKKR